MPGNVPSTTVAPRTTPRPYQQLGVQFVLDVFAGRAASGVKSRAALLADDPGLGKTFQALEVFRAMGGRRSLIVSPAIARVSWPIEIAKHAPELVPHLRVPAFSASPGGWVDLDRLVLLLTYDTFSHPASIRRWLPELLRAKPWDLLILDEAHTLKNNTSNRTISIYGKGGHAAKPGLERNARRVLLLTGTPTPNHAGELFPHYRTFWTDRLVYGGKPLDQTSFEERFTRYTDGPWGRAVHGSTSQDVLREALGPVILRRRRHEVLPELPPLQVQDSPLLMPLAPPVPAPLQKAANHLSVLTEAAMIHELTSLETSLSSLRRLLGEDKAEAAADWVDDRLNMGLDKILVFAWHTSVIEKIAERLRLHGHGVVEITGATSDKDRVDRVNRFQTDPGVRVFVGQARAAGAAITLTAATEVAIVEPSWVPGENDQCIARAWRMGQQNPVLASFLYVPGSLDERVMRAFRRKAGELTRLYETKKPIFDGELSDA